ncbi:3,4-dihydroxy-2-butanone-4-phosphate synthase [Mycolicibacterium sp. XJ1819]
MSSAVRLDGVAQAIADIAEGKPVVVIDDEDRENEGDIIFGAEKATPELMAFTIRHTSGLICVPMAPRLLDRLRIPPMTPDNQDKMQTAFSVSVDARHGVTTGISATDRARTARVLADPTSEPTDLTLPGHVFPLRYREGGVLVRRGHTEAAVDLAMLAGLGPAAVIGEVVNDDGTMKRTPELRVFADRHGLSMISIEELVRHRLRHEVLVQRAVETRLPTRAGEFACYGYSVAVDGAEHIALVYGDISGSEPVLTRVYSECVMGDVFGSCCRVQTSQLNEALERVAHEGRGLVVYLRGRDDRDNGLISRMRAHTVRHGGCDTLDARDSSAAAQILRDLGITSIQPMTDDPTTAAALSEMGVDVVERAVTEPRIDRHRLRVITPARERIGHDLSLDGVEYAASG